MGRVLWLVFIGRCKGRYRFTALLFLTMNYYYNYSLSLLLLLLYEIYLLYILFLITLSLLTISFFHFAVLKVKILKLNQNLLYQPYSQKPIYFNAYNSVKNVHRYVYYLVVATYIYNVIYRFEEIHYLYRSSPNVI